MKTRSHRAGDAARVVLLAAFLFLAVPILLVSLGFLGWRTTAARAQEARRQAVAANERAQRAAIEFANRAAEEAPFVAVPDSTPPMPLQPVFETEYRTETVEVKTPVRNPLTGQMEIQTTTQPRLVPVQVQRYARSIVEGRQDPAVPRLVSELVDLNEDDDQYEAKLNELRQRLDLEFTGMHEEQSKEILAIEERLAALKKLHQHRGENRDKIVQRRIDELLGRTDALAWEVNPSPAPQAMDPFMPRGPAVVPGLLEPPPRADSLPIPGLWQSDVTIPTPSRQPIPAPPLPPIAPQGPPPTSNSSKTSPASKALPTFKTFDSMPPSASTGADLPAMNAAAMNPAAMNPIPSQSTEPVDASRDIGPANSAGSDAATSVITRIFELAKKSGAANAALESAQINFELMSGLRAKGALPVYELEKARVDLEQIRREVQLSRLEIKAFEDSLRRSARFAEDKLANAHLALDAAKTRVDQGISPTSELIRSESEVATARERMEGAIANLKQLDQAMNLIRGSENQQADAAGDVEQADEASADSVEEQEVEINDDTGLNDADFDDADFDDTVADDTGRDDASEAEAPGVEAVER